MRRILCLTIACVSIMGCLYINAGAMDITTSDNISAETTSIRASGSFNMSVGAYERTASDIVFPMAAGETVRIRANYDPEDAKMDFGLIDPDGIYHYITVTTGSIDATIEISENGNYRLAIRNNSAHKVRVSGFVKY